MNLLEKAKIVLRSPVEATRLLAQLVQGTANQSRLLNDRMREVIAALDNQQRILNDKLSELVEASRNQSSILNDMRNACIEPQKEQPTLQRGPAKIVDALPNAIGANDPRSEGQEPTFQEALAAIPLLIDQKTYNTSHPDYDAKVVRNYPGRIFNADSPCRNTAYAELRKLAAGEAVPDPAWNKVLADTLEEAKAVPHAQQVFERRALIEQYTAALHRKYRAHYAPGWVNVDDALFLYWLVRRLKPNTIVQTGVCNGLSAAFMMLALAKNGPHGALRAIDLPPVFDPSDPAWTIRDKIYGVVIPEGKSSGWMVPDAYRDRVEVWNGDAKFLLPKLVDEVGAIDMFYHDSDHTYNHMMFEFREAKRKLVAGGLVVADDVSWNASVWDFADEYGAPAYNFKGSVGVAFF